MTLGGPPTNTSMTLAKGKKWMEAEGLGDTLLPRLSNSESPPPFQTTTNKQTCFSPPASHACFSPAHKGPRVPEARRAARSRGRPFRGSARLVAHELRPHPSPGLPEAPSPHRPLPSFFPPGHSRLRSGLWDHAPVDFKLYFPDLGRVPRRAPLPRAHWKASRAWPGSSIASENPAKRGRSGATPATLPAWERISC